MWLFLWIWGGDFILVEGEFVVIREGYIVLLDVDIFIFNILFIDGKDLLKLLSSLL